jgi:hypothetical protein
LALSNNKTLRSLRLRQLTWSILILFLRDLTMLLLILGELHRHRRTLISSLFQGWPGMLMAVGSTIFSA